MTATTVGPPIEVLCEADGIVYVFASELDLECWSLYGEETWTESFYSPVPSSVLVDFGAQVDAWLAAA